MTETEAIQVLINSQLLSIWDKDRNMSDPNGLKEIGFAYQVLNPTYHINWTCNDCLITLMNKANELKKEHVLKFHKFPK